MATIPMCNYWCVLYTRPKFEKKVVAEVDNLRLENYLPVRTVVKRWSDRIVKQEEPLFRSYVFVRIQLHQKTDVLQVPGVVKIICTNGVPVTISVGEIDRIRMIEKNGISIQPEDVLTPGVQVKVIHGVFAGLEGHFLKRHNGPGRFLIRLPLLKQAVSVEMEAGNLMRV